MYDLLPTYNRLFKTKRTKKVGSKSVEKKHVFNDFFPTLKTDFFHVGEISLYMIYSQARWASTMGGGLGVMMS